MAAKQLLNDVLDELESGGHARPISKVKEILRIELEAKIAAYDNSAAKERSAAIKAIARNIVTPAAIGAAYGSLYGVPSLPKKRSKRVIQEGAAPFGHVSGVPETVTGLQLTDIEIP